MQFLECLFVLTIKSPSIFPKVDRNYVCSRKPRRSIQTMDEINKTKKVREKAGNFRHFPPEFLRFIARKYDFSN